MIRTCSWCGKNLGYVGNKPGETHGICRKCRRRVLREWRKQELKARLARELLKGEK